MTILILIGMAVLVGVLLLYVFELGRSRRLLLKAGNARKALRSSEELFRSIMQNVHAFILLINRDFVVTRQTIMISPKPVSRKVDYPV